MLGRLEADVLHGVGVDFAAEDRLGSIEQTLVCQHAEDGGPCPKGRVRFDVALRQGEVEVLRMDFAAFLVDGDEPLGEGQILVK